MEEQNIEHPGNKVAVIGLGENPSFRPTEIPLHLSFRIMSKHKNIRRPTATGHKILLLI